MSQVPSSAGALSVDGTIGPAILHTTLSEKNEVPYLTHSFWSTRAAWRFSGVTVSCHTLASSNRVSEQSASNRQSVADSVGSRREVSSEFLRL